MTLDYTRSVMTCFLGLKECLQQAVRLRCYFLINLKILDTCARKLMGENESVVLFCSKIVRLAAH